MVSLKGRAVLSAGLLMALAGLNPVQADVPGALDHVPNNAAVIIMIRDMEQFRSRADDLAKALKAPIDAEDDHNPLNMSKKLLAADGIERHGSLALAVVPGADGTVDFDADEGPVVVVVPVKNYEAFAKGMGATDTTGVASLTIDGKPVFSKDLGDGYAAMGPQKALVEAFDGKAGHAAAHKALMGKTGQQVADKSDVVFLANLAALKPQVEQGVTQFKDSMKMAGAMVAQGGEQAQAAFEVMNSLADALVRDGQVGIMGLGLGDNGVSFDFGAQFKEGSPSAKMLSSAGHSSTYLARVPNQPFLFAMAMDLTGPSIKSAIKDMSVASAKAGGADGVNTMAVLSKTIDKVDGIAVCMGANAGGLMGLFSNVSTFVATSDPAGYMKATRDMTSEMNGKTINGMKTTVDYKQESEEVAGIKADSWKLQMVAADPNDPKAGPAQMMITMMFPNGMGGMAAPTANGVVATMSQNKPLLAKAIDAAKGEKGLGEDQQIKDIQKQFPENRSFEAYIGTKSLMELFNGLMGMQGGGVEIKIPEKVAPIGIAASTDGGGLDLRFFAPSDVIKAMAEVAETMKGGGDGGADAPAPAGDKPKAPRF